MVFAAILVTTMISQLKLRQSDVKQRISTI